MPTRAAHRITQAIVVVVAFGVLIWWIPWDTWPGALLGAFAPWVFGLAWLPALLALLLRLRWTGLVAGLLVVHHLWILWPPPEDTSPVVSGTSLRVVSSNLLMVHPDPAPLAALLASQDADLLLLQELSPRWVEALEAAGLFESHPHYVLEVRQDSFGTGILSRLPLEEAWVEDLGGVPLSRATVVVGGEPLHLVNVHTLPPRTSEYHRRWRQQVKRLAQVAQVVPGPLAIVGDFNASQHSRAIAGLEATGLRGAHGQVGRDRAVTFPNGLFPLPSVRLDHVLLSPELVATEVHELHRTGSDHSTLVVELGLRAD